MASSTTLCVTVPLDILYSTDSANVQGMQRFGTQPIPTHAVGLALLRSDWQTASKLIMAPRSGEQEDAVEARRLWNEDGNAKAALALMPRYAVAERCRKFCYLQ